MFQRLLTAVALVATLALPSIAAAVDWRAVSEPSVGMSFEMPGEPRREQRDPGEGDAVGTLSYLLRDDANRIYVVQISQAAMDLGEPKEVGDTGVEVMKEQLQGLTILTDAGSTQGTVYTRKTTARQMGDGMAAQVTLVRGRVLIAVVYVQPTGASFDPEGERFLASLKLTR